MSASGCRATRTCSSRGPSAVLYAIADHVVDTYVQVADSIENDIDEIEELAFADQHGRDAGRVYQVKRELMELRRAVYPLAQPLRVLTGTDFNVVDPKVRAYFRDVEDHLTRVHETIAGFDDLLGSLLQASLAQLSIAQNEDMRKITAWAAIIAVPTAIAGIYGMNFDYMPELGSRFGYPRGSALDRRSCASCCTGASSATAGCRTRRAGQGRTLKFWRNTLAGSYLRFTSVSRSRVRGG